MPPNDDTIEIVDSDDDEDGLDAALKQAFDAASKAVRGAIVRQSEQKTQGLRHEIEELQAKLKKAGARFDAWKGICTGLQDDVTALNKELGGVKTQLEEVKAERDAHKEKLGKATEELDKAKAELHQVKAELEGANGLAAALEFLTSGGVERDISKARAMFEVIRRHMPRMLAENGSYSNEVPTTPETRELGLCTVGDSAVQVGPNRLSTDACPHFSFLNFHVADVDWASPMFRESLANWKEAPRTQDEWEWYRKLLVHLRFPPEARKALEMVLPGVIPVFHKTTTWGAAGSIVRSGFRTGDRGNFGPGAYSSCIDNKTANYGGMEVQNNADGSTSFTGGAVFAGVVVKMKTTRILRMDNCINNCDETTACGDTKCPRYTCMFTKRPHSTYPELRPSHLGGDIHHIIVGQDVAGKLYMPNGPCIEIIDRFFGRGMYPFAALKVGAKPAEYIDWDHRATEPTVYDVDLTGQGQLTVKEVLAKLAVSHEKEIGKLLPAGVKLDRQKLSAMVEHNPEGTTASMKRDDDAFGYKTLFLTDTLEGFVVKSSGKVHLLVLMPGSRGRCARFYLTIDQ